MNKINCMLITAVHGSSHYWAFSFQELVYCTTVLILHSTHRTRNISVKYSKFSSVTQIIDIMLEIEIYNIWYCYVFVKAEY